MATRHKQQLSNYLSRHKNGIAPASSGGSSEDSSSLSAAPGRCTDTKSSAKSSSVTSSAHGMTRLTVGRTTYGQRTSHEGCLPDEILLKVFMYLDLVSLVQASQVCRRWRAIALDNSLWQRIAQTYTTRRTPTKQQKASTKAADSSPSFSTQWRDVCIARCAAWRNERALKRVKNSTLNPFTGLPRDTERALKETGITYQLSLVDGDGKESCSESSKISMHKSSAATVWHSLTFLPLRQVRRVRVLAVCPLFYNDKGVVVKGSPYQRSLLWEADLRLWQWTTEQNLLGEDDQVSLYHLPADLLLATWKADGEIAFFAAGLHYHQLVHRCMLGSSKHCYEMKPHKVIPDDIDSSYGLHDYRATVELRTLHQSMWSQQFSGLHCAHSPVPCADLGFTLIRSDTCVGHTPLEKQVCLPWRTELFKGSIKNMAWMDVTVLDERGEVFFTASSPIKAYKPPVQGSDFEYEEGEHLRMVYEGERASVHLQLGQAPHGKTFMRHLELRIKTSTVNAWFGTHYPTPPDSKPSSSSAR